MDPTVPIIQTAQTAESCMDEANMLQDESEQSERTALEKAYHCGLKLLESKIKAGHGNFIPLVEKRFKRNARIASRNIRLTKHWPEVRHCLTIGEAIEVIKEKHGEEVTSKPNRNGDTDLPKSGGGPSHADQPGKGTERSARTPTSPPPKQGRFDFDGSDEAMSAATARIAKTKAESDRKKALAEEVKAVCDQLLEVLPELAGGYRGTEFVELAGDLVKQEKTERGQFVGPKLVAEEVWTDRFPLVEKLRDATVAFLAKFVEVPT